MVPNTLIDPRGHISKANITLTPRPSFNELKNGKILFYDNTKLSFCHYAEVFSAIKRGFQQRGLSHFSDVRQTVRGCMTEDLRERARRLAQDGYVAAVVALADMGTSPMTTVLAVELEKAGIPTVLISAPPGDGLAKHVAYFRAGHFCICDLDIYQASTVAEIAAEVDGKISYIIDALTLPADRIEQCARLHPQLDQEPDATLDQQLSAMLPADAAGQVSQPGLYMDELMRIGETLSIGDGLPFIPPTAERVARMETYCPYSPDEVLVPEAGPSGQDIKVRDVMVNAVMAGCEPQHLPVIIAAFKAMRQPQFNFQQAVTTSYNGGTLLLVSGPIAKELKIHSGQGCLGPGFRANATIGRAVNLTILNVCRAYPGKADLGCLASPAEFTYCFAEDPEHSPWPCLNEEHADAQATTVYVLKGEPPTDVVDFLSSTSESLLETIIDSASHLGRMNAYIPGRILVVLTPDHARILRADGWSKDGLRKLLFDKVTNPRAKVEGRGLVPVRPDAFRALDPVPATRGPKDFDLVVAGGRGGHSAIIASWGLYSDAVVQPLELPDGRAASSIQDFLR